MSVAVGAATFLVFAGFFALSEGKVITGLVRLSVGSLMGLDQLRREWSPSAAESDEPDSSR